MTFDPWTMIAEGSTAPALDEAEARRALAILLSTDAYHMAQALPSARWAYVTGNDLDGALSSIRGIAAGKGVYVSLNAVPEPLTHCLKSGDVKRRLWFLIDLDAIRPDTDASATEDEKAAAGEAAHAIDEYLARLEWPAPVVIDSGNGWHLVYRIDLPADAASQKLLRGCLKALAARFDTAGARVDTATHDAKRITKLPGTWVRKGADTPERPHRMARLWSVPDRIEPVPADRLAELAALAAEPEPARPERAAFDPWTMHARNGAGHDLTRYLDRALELECNALAGARVGDRNNALNAAAFSLGTLVPLGLDEGKVRGGLARVASMLGLGDRETMLTVNSGVEAGKKNPRPSPESKAINGTHTTATAPVAAPDGAVEWEIVIDGEVIDSGLPSEVLPQPAAELGRRVRSWEIHTLAGLMEREFPEPVWVVPNMLSEGLNILAGKPKMGKSMMSLNLAMTVAAGGKALGNIPTTAGDVLYISLEDRTRRIQSRARKMLKAAGYRASNRLMIATTWPRQGDGGLEQIEWWIRRVKRPALVIIDVWGKFRPAQNAKANAYTQDYEHIAPLKDLMDRYSCSALALLHCRKGASDDVVEEVSGTMGLSGAADGIVVLQRARNENEAKIFVTGRDVSDQELALEFDPETLTWKNLGTAEEHVTGKLQLAILEYLKLRNGVPSHTADIAAALERKADEIRPVLHKLFNRGHVRRHGQAWVWPGEGEGAEPDFD